MDRITAYFPNVRKLSLDDYAVSILGSQKTPIVDDPQAFGVV